MTGIRTSVIAIFLLGAVTTLPGQTGTVTGIVTDSDGAAIPGAFVRALLRKHDPPVNLLPSPLRSLLPVDASAPTDEKGQFTIARLDPGVYWVCAEKSNSSLLDPCLWGTQQREIVVRADNITDKVPVVMQYGVPVVVRIDDPNTYLADRAKDDIRVGALHANVPLIPARTIARDSSGRTMAVTVPADKPATLSLSSNNFALADDNNRIFASRNVELPVPAQAAIKSGASISDHPAITIHVSGNSTKSAQ